MSVEAFVTELALTIPALVGTFPVECAGATFATGGVTVGDQTTSLAKAAKMIECMCVNFSQLTFIKNNKGSQLLSWGWLMTLGFQCSAACLRFMVPSIT